jgi:hypothetical protein
MNDADWQRVAKHGMTALYYPVTDPPADVRRRIMDTRQRVLTPGLYAAWNWWPALDGAAFAEKVHALATACTPVGTLAPKVQLDIETHDPGYILAALRRWRALRPYQDTSWTLESMQAGWMTPAFVAEVIQLKIRVVPQYYGGDMAPFAQDMALRNLIRVGFPEKLVTGFYNAAALPHYWDGFAFSMGTLP